MNDKNIINESLGKIRSESMKSGSEYPVKTGSKISKAECIKLFKDLRAIFAHNRPFMRRDERNIMLVDKDGKKYYLESSGGSMPDSLVKMEVLCMYHLRDQTNTYDEELVFDVFACTLAIRRK